MNNFSSLTTANLYKLKTADILVVDDEEYNRDMLCRRLQRAGYQVRSANNGFEALKAVNEQLPAAILLDVMMPELDGMAVLREIRIKWPAHKLPILMVTARDAGEHIVEALKSGANDYITKPIDFPVLLARLQTHLALREALISLEERELKINADLEIAYSVHRKLFPSNLPQIRDFSIGFKFLPSAKVGGDFFDITPMSDCIGLFFADISGHGVAGALLTALLKTLLHEAFKNSFSASEAFQKLNDRIAEEFPEGMFVSAVHLSVSHRQPVINIVSACPDPGLVLKANGNWHPLPRGAPFLGMFMSDSLPEGKFPELSIQLEPQDRLVIVSDGLIEVRNPPGRSLAIDGLGEFAKSLVQLQPQPFVEALLEKILEFAGTSGTEDDLMALALQFDGNKIDS